MLQWPGDRLSFLFGEITGGKQHHTLVPDSEHTQPSREPCHSPARYCHKAGAVTESSKGHSTVLLRTLLLERGDLCHGINQVGKKGLVSFDVLSLHFIVGILTKFNAQSLPLQSE